VTSGFCLLSFLLLGLLLGIPVEVVGMLGRLHVILDVRLHDVLVAHCAKVFMGTLFTLNRVGIVVLLLVPDIALNPVILEHRSSNRGLIVGPFVCHAGCEAHYEDRIAKAKR